MALQPINYGAFSGDALGSLYDTRRQMQASEQGVIQTQLLGQQQQAQQQQLQAQQQQAAIQQQAAQVYQTGTPEELADFLIQNPSARESVIGADKFVSERSERSKLEAARNIVLGGDPDTELTRSAQVIAEEGGNPKDTLGMINQPDQVKIDSAKKVWAALDSTGFKSAMSAAGEAQEVVPAETRAFEGLIEGFTPEEQDNARKIKAGLKGRAVSNAVLSAIDSGDITSLAQAKAEIKQAEKFSEMSAASRAKTIDKSYDGIQKIDAGIRNIDDALGALGTGAGTGAIEKFFPSIKAASVELENIRGRMALDVVGATTFGALSAGELALAKDIALPTGLNEPELKDYLTRKRDSQMKLRDYYSEQIDFLDQGGTVAGFLRSKERDVPQGQPAQQQQQAQQESQSYSEGQTATSPDGRRAVYTNGQWVIQ